MRIEGIKSIMVCMVMIATTFAVLAPMNSETINTPLAGIPEYGVPDPPEWSTSAEEDSLYQLTTNPADDIFPSWSQSSRQIAFASNREGNFDIFVMSEWGHNQEQLTTDSRRDLNPSWNPDDSKMVFARAVGADDDLWSMNANGGGQTPLYLLGDSQHPKFSPNGNKISFDRNIPVGSWPFNHEIFVTGYPLTTKPVQITDFPIGNHQEYADWSPDGSKIVFSSIHWRGPEDTTGIWVVNANLGMPATPAMCTQLLDHGIYPVWSHDGTKIAFASDIGGNWDIWVMDVTGNVNLKQITTDPANDLYPSWSPDDRRIAFHSDRSGNYDIWVSFMPSQSRTWIELPHVQGNILGGLTGPNVAVVWTDQDKAYGYSSHTSRWSGPHSISGNIVHIWPSPRGENVALLRSDSGYFYAFSAITGTWDDCTLPYNPNDWIRMAKNVALVWDSSNAYAFSANSGEWHTISATGISVFRYNQGWAAENVALLVEYDGNTPTDTHVFTAVLSEWRSLGGGENMPDDPVGKNVAVVGTGPAAYGFSALTGLWYRFQAPSPWYTWRSGTGDEIGNTFFARSSGSNFWVNGSASFTMDGRWYNMSFQNTNVGQVNIYGPAEHIMMFVDRHGIGGPIYIRAFSALEPEWKHLATPYLTYVGIDDNIGLVLDTPPASGLRAHGFSAFTGEFHAPKQIAGDVTYRYESKNTAMIATSLPGSQDGIYAYSAITDRWDSRVAEEINHNHNRMNENIALAHTSTSAFAFSAHSGKWYELDEILPIAIAPTGLSAQPNIGLLWTGSNNPITYYAFSALTKEWKVQETSDSNWPHHRQSTSRNVALVWNDQYVVPNPVYGFSAITGEWNGENVDGQIERTGTGGNIAAITTTNHPQGHYYAYAFDAHVGEWYPQYIEGATSISTPRLSVDDNVALAWSSTHAYAYGKFVYPGDLLFIQRPGWQSILGWNHVAMVGYNDEVIEALPDFGVQITTLDEFLGQPHLKIGLVKVETSAEIKNSAVQFAYAQIGKPFDPDKTQYQVYGDSYYSSELVWAAYKHATGGENGRLDLDSGKWIEILTPWGEKWLSWTPWTPWPGSGIEPNEIFNSHYTYEIDIFYSNLGDSSGTDKAIISVWMNNRLLRKLDADTEMAYLWDNDIIQLQPNENNISNGGQRNRNQEKSDGLHIKGDLKKRLE